MQQDKKQFILVDEYVRQRAAQFLSELPLGWVAIFQKRTRNLEQNAAQWPILEAFSEQLEWPVNGKMCKLTPEEWKDVLTAAFRNETARLAMGLSGGVVMLGMRTSKMSKQEFSDWLDFLHHVAADRGVDVEKRTQV